MSIDPDSYSAIYAQMQRDYALSIGDAATDPHEAHAVAVAVAVDQAVDECEANCQKLLTDQRGLKR